MITVVTGLPRSGTSMLMQMLEAGGVEVQTDGVRTADENNVRGYYEIEKVKSLGRDSGWIGTLEGKAVKVVVPLVMSLPATFRYRIILIERNIDEVLDSQTKMLERLGKPPMRDRTMLRNAFQAQLARAQTWIAACPGATTVTLAYSDVLADPLKQAHRLAEYMPAPFDASAAASVVAPDLYRERREPSGGV